MLGKGNSSKRFLKEKVVQLYIEIIEVCNAV